MRAAIARRALQDDDDASGEELSSSAMSCDTEAARPISQQSTPFFQRLRMQMTWGKTTREEKRALWAGAHGVTRRKPPRRQKLSNIAIPTDLLLKALCSRLSEMGELADDGDVAELSALLRLQLRHELMESSLWLVDAFDLLSDGGGSVPGTPTGAGGGGLGFGSCGGLGGVSTGSPAELELLSDRFIDGLCGLMLRANYRMLSQREWEFAKSENFMFTLPVDVAWESLDSATISRLFVRHPHLGLQAAQLARRVLVFHRGTGVAQMT